MKYIFITQTCDGFFTTRETEEKNELEVYRRSIVVGSGERIIFYGTRAAYIKALKKQKG